MWHCKLRYGSMRQFSSTLAVYVLTRTRLWPFASAVCEHGPPYSPYLNKFPDVAELGPTNRSWTPTNFSRYPYGPQDDKFSYHNGARDNAIEMFNSTQLPIKAAVAKEFAVFNHLHGSVPSYSTPNRAHVAELSSALAKIFSLNLFIDLNQMPPGVPIRPNAIFSSYHKSPE